MIQAPTEGFPISPSLEINLHYFLFYFRALTGTISHCIRDSLPFYTVKPGNIIECPCYEELLKEKRVVIPNPVEHYRIKKGLSLSNGDFTFFEPENRLRIQLNILVSINTGF